MCFCKVVWSDRNGSLGLSVCFPGCAFPLVKGMTLESTVKTSSPRGGQPRPRNRASALQFPKTSPGRSSPASYLLTAGFGTFKAKNMTQSQTKLFNLDLPHFWGFGCLFVSFFVQCKLEIKNYRNCYAHVTSISTAVENSHPALAPS